MLVTYLTKFKFFWILPHKFAKIALPNIYDISLAYF